MDDLERSEKRIIGDVSKTTVNAFKVIIKAIKTRGNLATGSKDASRAVHKIPEIIWKPLI